MRHRILNAYSGENFHPECALNLKLVKYITCQLVFVFCFAIGFVMLFISGNTLAQINQPPEFTSTPVTTAFEGQPYTYNLTTTDDVVSGMVVWQVLDTLDTFGPNFEIYLYDGTSVANISNTNTPFLIDYDPQINSSGKVVWWTDDNEVYLYDGTSTNNISNTPDIGGNGLPQINNLDQVIWSGPEGYLLLYDGTTTTQIPDSLGGVRAQISNDLVLSAPMLPAWLTLTDNGGGTGTLYRHTNTAECCHTGCDGRSVSN